MILLRDDLWRHARAARGTASTRGAGRAHVRGSTVAQGMNASPAYRQLNPTHLMRMIEPVYEQLGRAIREARERRGMEQDDLAARVGVGQQAVSTWERGKSRPRRAMVTAVAEALQVAEELLLDAGGYRGTAAVPPSARPLARTLPLDELPPDRFEDIVTDVMGPVAPTGR